jgi:hypothetical protein
MFTMSRSKTGDPRRTLGHRVAALVPLVVLTAIASSAAFGQEMPPGREECGASCSQTRGNCYGRNFCSDAVDWPVGLSATCERCNQEALICAGICMSKNQPTMSYEGCNPICNEAGVVCGMPDGCGGVCNAETLCGLLVRHPRLAPAILWM